LRHPIGDRSRSRRDAAHGALHGRENGLRATLARPDLESLHASANGLLAFIAARQQRHARIAALAATLSNAEAVTAQDLVDYRWLLNRSVGDTVDYEYAGIENREQLLQDPMTDWIATLQASGEGAFAHALTRWQQSRSALWLVPVLWKIPASHPQANAALEQAATIERASPAFATVAFLRARLLLARGDRTAARRLLEQVKQATGLGIETTNLFNALRVRAAETFDELIETAERTMVEPGLPPTLDEDSARLFSHRLPLSRLIEAAAWRRLDAPIRRRLAGAALARAIVLRDEAAGVAAAQLLLDLAPSMRADLDVYLRAAGAERHRVGILLLLRTSGLSAYVAGLDGPQLEDTAGELPRREVGHSRQNWWCVTNGRLAPPTRFPHASELDRLIAPDSMTRPLPFLSDAEGVTARQQQDALVDAGSPQGYLAEEAVKWAQAAPTDLRAAEALALAVQGGRWSCGVSASSRRAFQTLHRLFPKSEWARRTRYWYES
jgi:hypothetical protein